MGVLTLDIFDGNFCGLVEMTEAINCPIALPDFLLAQNWFQTENHSTDKIWVERKFNELQLIKTAARGTEGTFNKRDPKEGAGFKIPHLPKSDNILACDLFGEREFGKANSLATVRKVLMERQAEMKAEHMLTWEHMMWGAINGSVMDSDGVTELVNMFDCFNFQKKTAQWDSSEANSLRKVVHACKTAIKIALQGKASRVQFYMLVGSEAHLKLMCSDEFKCAFERFQDGARLRQDADFDVFPWYGVNFYEVYSAVGPGGYTFLQPNEMKLVAVVPGRFKRHNAPGCNMAALGTKALEMYSSTERMKHDRGVELFSESNPLMLDRMPFATCHITCVDGGGTVLPSTAPLPAASPDGGPVNVDPNLLVKGADPSGVTASVIENAEANHKKVEGNVPSDPNLEQPTVTEPGNGSGAK